MTRAVLVRIYTLLEEELGERPLFGGDELGFVDVVLSHFACLGPTPVRNMEASPKIMGWVKRCMT